MTNTTVAVCAGDIRWRAFAGWRRACIWLLALGFSLSIVNTACATRVWIDTDPAIGAPWREVDDAFALLLAFRSPELQIVGISSSYGNASLHTTTRVADVLVARFAGGSIAVHPGARNAADLGRRTAASDALATALSRQRLTYVALGPLTNLATLLILHPRLRGRIERVIFAGGQSSATSLRFGCGGWLKIHDANVVKDRAAAATVLASHVPLTLAPPEIGCRLALTTDDLRELSRSGADGAFLQSRSRIWLWFWRRVVGNEGGPLFDALPMLAVSRSKAVQTRTAFAKLDGDLRFAAKPNAGARKVIVCSGLTAHANRTLLQRLTK